MTTHKTLTHQTFLSGEVLFLSGDAADCAYIIESGHVRLTVDDDPFERNQEIAIVSDGDLLGEMGIIDDSPRSATATAITETQVTIISREQIQTRLKNADPILRSVMEVILWRLRDLVSPIKSEARPKHDDIKAMTAEGVDKMRFESELRYAMKNNDIQIVYQPLMDLKNNYWAGFEALSRWTHPDLGFVSPFKFITLAEETEMIVPMGMKAFETACQSLVAFQKQRTLIHPELDPLFMSINVSARQLTSKRFLPGIKESIERHQINPKHIKVEITESLVVDYNKVKSGLDECRAMGFTLSLDDFGTGYSGFQHLLELDFHTLKIDQAFTMSMFKNSRSQTLIQVVVDMAKKLSMEIVAEGIETEKDSKLLTKIGVDYGQGYFYAKPMPKDKALEGLKSGS